MCSYIIMSGQPLKSPSDASKFRQQYMATLALQSNINDANLQANKIYKRTGQTPTQPTDMRLTSEKLADLQRLKMEVRGKLGSIMDGVNAEEVAYDLSPDALIFLAQNIDAIVKELKPKYQLGITAPIFIPYLINYMTKSNQVNETSYGLQQATGGDVMMGAEQIREVVNEELLNAIWQILQSGYINEPLKRGLAQNINILQREILPLSGYLTELGEEDVETRHIYQQYFNSIYNDIATQRALSDPVRKLNEAVLRGDRRMADIYAEQLRQMLAVEPSAREEAKQMRLLIEDVRRGDNIPPPEDLGGGGGEEKVESRESSKGKSRPILQSPVEQLKDFEIRYGPTELLEADRRLSKRELEQDIIPTLLRITGYNLRPKQFFAEVMGGEAHTKGKLNKQEYGLILERLKEDIDRVKTGGSSLGMLEPSPPPPGWDDRLSGSTVPYSSYRTGSSPYSVKQGKGLRSGRVYIAPVIDYSKGVMPVANFIPFGKLFINTDKLGRGIISLRKGKGAYLTSLPVRRVSPTLNDIIKVISGGGSPTYTQLSKLDDEERRYLYDLGKASSLGERIGIPAPTKDEDDRDINQFEIMKGEISSGNDSIELVKKFKALIIKMMGKGLLPKGQGKALMVDLVELGY